MARARWSAVSGIAGQLGSAFDSQGIAHHLQYALPEGLTVDIALFRHVPDARSELTGGSGGGVSASSEKEVLWVAVMLCAACDVSPAAAVSAGGVGSLEDAVLKPKELSGRMQQHVGLLRRQCGVPVVCLSAERLEASLSVRGSAELSMQWIKSLCRCYWVDEMKRRV